MHRPVHLTVLPCSILLAAGIFFRVAAQTPQSGASAQATDAGKKVLTLADYGKWNRITSTALSPDGKWMTYAYQPNTGDTTLFVKQLDGDKLYTIPVGSAGGGGGRGGPGGGGPGGGSAQFSDNSRWVVYYVNPPQPAAGRGAGRGAAPGGARGGTRGGGSESTAAAAPRNGKQVIFLSYPDEPHHFAKEENQKDFQVRMTQFFDHYLKGAPAPKWMTDGVPQTHKGGPIK